MIDVMQSASRSAARRSSCSSGDASVRDRRRRHGPDDITFGTSNCGALHAEAGVVNLSDILGCDGLPETRPARAGVEFRGWNRTAHYRSRCSGRARFVQIPVLTGEGEFGIGVARDVEGVRESCLRHWSASFHDLRDLDFFQALAGIGEENDCDFFRFCHDSRGGFSTAGFRHCQKARPAMVATEVARNTRR